MSEQSAPQSIPAMENPNANPAAVNGIPAVEGTDIPMTDAPLSALPTQNHQQQPPPQPQLQHSTPTTTTPSPFPTTARIPTPVPIPTPGAGPGAGAGTGPTPTSRAASAHPDPTTTTSGTTTSGTTTSGTTATAMPMPSEATPNGAPVRQYINSKITGVLLEAMKVVAREQPKDPLRVLGEFLLQRSKELEGSS